MLRRGNKVNNVIVYVKSKVVMSDVLQTGTFLWYMLHCKCMRLRFKFSLCTRNDSVGNK